MAFLIEPNSAYTPKEALTFVYSFWYAHNKNNLLLQFMFFSLWVQAFYKEQDEAQNIRKHKIRDNNNKST